MPSENTKRIAKNTSMLYIRMFLTILVSLYTSRVVLNVLGVDDYGIYNVVGGMVTMFGFLNSSMAIAVQRYLSFEIGQYNWDRLHKIFSLSLLVHFVLAVIIAVVAEIIGYWILSSKLNIPPDRFSDAIWVFHASILACCANVIRVPYNAVIIAREKMNVYAYMSILEVCLNLAIVYILLIGDIDKLRLYAILTTGVTCIVTIGYVLYCRWQFQESRFVRYWNKSLFKELVSFAGGSALGEMSWVATLQGVNLVLNLFFGPAVNTARAISVQVTGAVSRFIISFQTAVNPQLIKYYAANEKEMMFELLFRSTNFSFFLMLFFSVPILLETEFILKLWLKIVPDYSVLFCRLAIINSLIDSFSNLLATAAKAYGKIWKYQIYVAFILFLNLPLSYIALKFGASPEYTFYVYGILSFLLLIVRLYLLHDMIGFPVWLFLRELSSNIWITLSSLLLPVTSYLFMAEGWGRFFAVFTLSIISVVLSVYFIGLKKNERAFFIDKVKSLLTYFK